MDALREIKYKLELMSMHTVQIIRMLQNIEKSDVHLSEINKDRVNANELMFRIQYLAQLGGMTNEDVNRLIELLQAKIDIGEKVAKSDSEGELEH